jgi:NADH-quinone oxidoreductase subunit F
VTAATSYILRQDKDYTDLATYRAAGGYEAVKKAHAMGPKAVTAEVKSAIILGRGGAGFPAGLKWSFVPTDSPKPKYLVVNADEGEPGTFKDRWLLNYDPHRLIEGCIICGIAVGIHTTYIYVRGEFFAQQRILQKAIDDARAAGILGPDCMGTGHAMEIHVHPGAGAYICGEETALLESLEGKPGQPRLKPPFPAVVGAFGCPTVINNVETLAVVPLIIEHGAAWWNGLGVAGDGGVRLYGVSGHVKKPGLYELPVGIALDTIIYEVCGGIAEDRELKAVIPGGVSCPVLTPAEVKGLPMTVKAVREAGSMLGTCGIIVMAEGTCLVKCLQRIGHFYAHESCGQCTPCREGAGWVSRMVDQIEAGLASHADFDNLCQIAHRIGGNTICAFGDAVDMATMGFVTKFESEFRAHIDQGGCPFEGRRLPAWG